MRPFDYSFEFFPPKTARAERAMNSALDALELLNPEFVSITYGAGGTTRKRTLKAVEQIIEDRLLAPASHITCVAASRAEVDEIIQDNLDLGVKHFVALRGDPPGGLEGRYEPHPDGYAYGSDLVAGIRRLSPKAEISVSAYAERHPESQSWDAELDNLKRKIDAGACRAITQFFFEPKTFLSLRERVAAANINVPIVPGIMLQPNFEGLSRMADMCHVHIPPETMEVFDKAGDSQKARCDATIELATQLVDALRLNGVNYFHFYTLNRAPIAIEVIKNIRSGSKTSAAQAFNYASLPLR